MSFSILNEWRLDQDEIIAAGHSMGAAAGLPIQWMAIKKPPIWKGVCFHLNSHQHILIIS